MTPETMELELRWNGSDYDPAHDDARLTGQILRVFACMKDEQWRTLSEIENATHDPQASISAQLRHLRKERFGASVVNKRPRGDRSLGLFEYQLIPSKRARLLDAQPVLEQTTA